MDDDQIRAVKKDRAELACELTNGVDYIAIADGNRLLLLGGIKGDTEETKLKDAKEQVNKKMQPWEKLTVMYKLVRV